MRAQLRLDVPDGSLIERDTAWQLHRAWPNSKLVVLDDAGHAGGSFTSELVGALDSFRALP